MPLFGQIGACQIAVQAGKVSLVKGSPLLRALLVAVVVVVVGVALQMHIGKRWLDGQPVARDEGQTYIEGKVAVDERFPFELQLSAGAKRVILQQGELLVVDHRDVVSELRGEFLAMEGPIFVLIQWADGSRAPRYFAKLRIDPPGKESVEHVFDSAGEIADVWELP